MKHIMNKLFKRNLTINEDQVEIDPTFDLDLRTMVAAVIPGESFEKQLETQILEMAAAKNKTSAHESTQKQAGWFSLNTPVKKFSMVGLTIVVDYGDQSLGQSLLASDGGKYIQLLEKGG